jgi:AcrR family transcriptional regulator
MTAKHDDTRRRLLEAAGEVFADKGYRAATIREICRRAKANVAAVNYYFGDKQGLYVAVVGYAHGKEDGIPLPELPRETPPEEKLRGFIEQVLSTHFEEKGPPWRARLMIREMAEPTEACAALVDAFVRPRAELLHEILGELLPPETSEADRHLIAFSIVGQCLFHRARNPVAEMLSNGLSRQFDVKRLADHITRFTLAALGRAEPIGGSAGRLGESDRGASFSSVTVSPLCRPRLAPARRE